MTRVYDIDWSIVNKHLTCPICGDKATLSAESNGTEGYHSHYFSVSREKAEAITQKYRTPQDTLRQRLKYMSDETAEHLVNALKEWEKP